MSLKDTARKTSRGGVENTPPMWIRVKERPFGRNFLAYFGNPIALERPYLDRTKWYARPVLS